MSKQRSPRSDALRDWLYTLVGLCGLLLVLNRPDPNPVVVVALASLAGRPVYTGLGDVLAARRNGVDRRSDDDPPSTAETADA